MKRASGLRKPTVAGKATVSGKPTVAGKHWIVEFYGAHALSDLKAIRRALKNAASRAGATLLKTQLHHFGVGADGAGAGVTGVALLAESHISIHTWPELEYAAIDIFMCGRNCSPAAALDSLCAELSPKRVKVKRLIRKMPRATTPATPA